MDYTKLVNDLYRELMFNVRCHIKDEKKIELIEATYYYAANLHKEQKRHSGEPYIIHPLNVALILSKTPLCYDASVICACILHDVVEDCGEKEFDNIREKFGEDIAILVDGVTKINGKQLSKEEKNAINTRKIILSVIKDIRIMYIKLADRLHNMRTLQYLREEKRIDNSLETLEVYVPFANALGAYQIKCELEDASLKYINPEAYLDIKGNLERFEYSNHSYISKTTSELQNLLIPSIVTHQTKNIYDIYKRLERYDKIENIPNLMAFKIISNDINTCYEDLKKVILNYPVIDEWYKNYIERPKTNLYQSLHISFYDLLNMITQVQIRTSEMDKFTHYGIASFCDENNSKAIQEQIKKLQFYKVLSKLSEIEQAPDFVSNVKKDILSKKVYVYDTNGDVFELPLGSTVVDFAYYVYRDLEDKEMNFSVNEINKVLPGHILKSNDVVDIQIGSKRIDSNDYFKYANTAYAKRKIKRA